MYHRLATSGCWYFVRPVPRAEELFACAQRRDIVDSGHHVIGWVQTELDRPRLFVFCQWFLTLEYKAFILPWW
jgi:hypothetical protein